jgi:hypothetical protein
VLRASLTGIQSPPAHARTELQLSTTFATPRDRLPTLSANCSSSTGRVPGISGYLGSGVSAHISPATGGHQGQLPDEPVSLVDFAGQSQHV